MPEDNIICTSPFTIDLACALALKCSIQECPVDTASCPFGYDGKDIKLCAGVPPSLWVRTLKDKVR